ncbi:hypothetical protein [Lactiplantibacillus plantarum]|uniref:hypothetical protein n=1 Tax=Lactiplantibacillus plantarum TaxID=1590 RepID=UPI001BADCA94|nr:hypothetical protein [Lactiplantibacillus plantarum]MBS0955476.1 hypothetical protein [Lactiplantibacillus plantarum]
MVVKLPGVKKNRHLSDQFWLILEQLSAFDTVEHKWAIEIGEYDNALAQFKVDDQHYQQTVKSVDWPRIQKERRLYQQLVQVRPIPFTEFEANEQLSVDERQDYLRQAATMAKYDFTEREICQELNLSRDFLKINRVEYRQIKEQEGLKHA